MAVKYQVAEVRIAAVTPVLPLYDVAEISLTTEPPLSSYQVAEISLEAENVAYVHWYDGADIQSGQMHFYDGSSVVDIT